MKIKLTKLLLVLAFMFLAQTVFAQTDDDDGLATREGVSSAFTKNRQNGAAAAAKRKYNKGKVKPPRRRKPPAYKPPPKTAPIMQLGLTMWRLRSEKSADKGARLLTHGDKLVGERVSSDTIFQPKDKVRIGFESPRTGYLYVFDREMQKDGRLGDAYMIFPTLSTLKGNNQVKAGTLIEIPAQTDDPFYFEITPSGENYTGELLTIIVSPTKLPNLTLQEGPIKISAAILEKWEDDWEVDTAADDLIGGENLYSESEKEAGSGKRQLTREEPVPQTMFSVKIPAKGTILVNFELKVKP